MFSRGACLTLVSTAILLTHIPGRGDAIGPDSRKRDLPFDVLDRYFAVPPNDYRLVQYTGHGSPILPADKMRAYGIGGVMFFLGSHQYLRNPAAWERMAENIRLAKAAGMQVWVGDDNGYPSGTAGGLVVEADAACEARGLGQIALDGEGPGVARVTLPRKTDSVVHAAIYPRDGGSPNLAAGRPARVAADHVEADGLDGPWRLSVMTLEAIDEGTQAMQTAKQFGTSGRYANLLNADAMSKFVDLTHEEYVRQLGSLTSKIDLFYTNEPNLMTVYFEGGSRPGGEAFTPWDTTLPTRFRDTHGYELLPRLPALFGGDDDEAKLVRRHFYQTVGDTMAENFTGRIARWGKAHGVLSGGHLLLEEYTSMHVICYGDFLRALAEEHVPGCDIPMPAPGDYWNYWMPKYVSSAAYLRGREMVSALLDPIIGRPEPLLEPSPEDFRRYINMAYLTGVNQISTYIHWQNYAPEVYRGFNEYAGRLAVMLRGASNASQVALYYPIETFQSRYVPSPAFWSPIAWANRDLQASQDNTARGLLEHHADFIYLNADAVLAADLRGDRLVLGDSSFSTMIMPRVELLPLNVLKKLDAFDQAGGTVLWVDALPSLGDAPEEHASVRAHATRYAAVRPEEAVDRIGPAYPERFRIAFNLPESGFFIGRYNRQNKNLYYVVNNTAAEGIVSLRNGTGPVKVYTPLDGHIETRNLPTAVTMVPYTAIAVTEDAP